jgi:ABC-2 type transport system permease protein
MTHAASIPWLAAHEFRLAWRDWASMLTGGKRGRVGAVAIGIGAFVLFMHAIAYVTVGPFAGTGPAADRRALLAVTGFVLLAWCLMISQAMEAVTRAFYSRSDLDLILASPVAARRVFAVRIATLALSTMTMSVVIAGPFANVLAILGGSRWLSAYGVFLAMGAAATALAVTFTVGLFRTIGPRRTRFVAQVVAAVIGAMFVIGLQVAAILHSGTLVRVTFLFSDTLLAHAPASDSSLWWPARAILGDPTPLAAVLAVGFAMLASVLMLFAPRFGEHAIVASGTVHTRSGQAGVTRPFRDNSPARALRQKEWTLLRRDPWLISQSLMQILYLLPPALLLWRNFGENNGIAIVLIPLLVMAAGQLAGGLAWLAISGEDAPDLVASAPVPPGWIVRAKIEAVLLNVAIVFAPFVLAFAIISPVQALVTAWFGAIAACAATAIQFWFRAQAKRSHFRRRHTSSRIATFAEAFSSISWAGTAALASVGAWQAIVVGLLAVGVLLVARLVSPHRAARA